MVYTEILYEREKEKKLIEEKEKEIGEEREMQEFETQVAMASCSSPSHSLSYSSNVYTNVSDVSSCSSVSSKLQVSTSDSSCQTPLYLTNKTPRKLKLQNELQSKNKEIKDMKKQINAITQQLVPVNTVEQMLTLCKKNTKAVGYRYSNEFKQLALTIYFLGPRDEIIGFNETNNRKTYNPAKFVLVLMIQGVNFNWKQPIAYFFVSNSCTGFDLQDIILTTFVSDMSSNFIGLSNSKNNLRTAPKITYSHIFPGPFEKMRVYLAAQVFSESVAAGMLVFLASSHLPDTSLPTINFIQNMDKLFDIFNSSKRPGLKKFNRPFKNTDTQISHLKFMENFFKTLQVFNKKTNVEVTNQMKFIRGWLILISGLFHLWESLKVTNTDENYVLYTNRINQDSCEVCIHYAKSQNKLDESFLLCYFKAYENSEKSMYGNLMMPQHEFYNYIDELENIFINRFPQISIENEVENKDIKDLTKYGSPGQAENFSICITS
ncbi:hypothetical protein AGLY_017470 [Aphis glycines]|uniref:THAP-type domain-containing protein n=1 Tax=Aphis glycines TaxID=307491 RepID=A0A6G0SUS1_APHGL|nr:hypothetical protein AGLY_017470 [Aphis glycines]